MTVDDVVGELGVARSTFYEWLKTGRGPRSFRLPNGARRIYRTDYDAWIAGLSDGGDAA
jgi:predicted DNA-binding transcriptional regulator AlpA